MGAPGTVSNLQAVPGFFFWCPMPLIEPLITEANAKQLILLEVGAGLDGLSPAERTALDVVTPNIDLIWAYYAARAYWPGLQALYAKKKCLQILRGQLRLKMDITIGPVPFRFSQMYANLAALLKETCEEIAENEKMARKNRAVVGGDVLRTAPLLPADLAAVWHDEATGGYPDPNSPRYTGAVRGRPDFAGGDL